MIEIRRIDHVALGVAHLAAATARWSVQFGLGVRALDEERALLACFHEHYSLELLQADEPGFDHVGWELRRDCGLDDARRHLENVGERWDDLADDTILVRDPEGFAHQLLPYREPADDLERRPPASRWSTTIGGYHPLRLGHVNRLSADVPGLTAWHERVLGMHLTDWLGTAGAWLNVNSDHHVMALVGADAPHFHHLAFAYHDLGELRGVFDQVAQHGRWLSWGPVRHGVGNNICGYVRITEEPLHVECYTDMEQLEPDHQPREWPDDRHSSNTWGPLPPRSYFRFDEVAVASESRSDETRGILLPPPG